MCVCVCVRAAGTDTPQQITSTLFTVCKQNCWQIIKKKQKKTQHVRACHAKAGRDERVERVVATK